VAARLLGVVVDRVGAGPFPITGLLAAIARTSQQICGLVFVLVAVRYLSRARQALSN
jgi:ribose/xylose/arabinose/galactoside ABC-type transport system permease subunit